MGSTWRRVTVAVTAMALAPLVWSTVPDAGAHTRGEDDHRGEVDASEDDPEGCTTATSEQEDGCGARGREHFGSADHVPPVEACSDRRTEHGGRILRILPDGPRHDDGSLAFISGACVYLPPGYGDSGLRYPVLYLLHGGGGDQGNWVTRGGVEEILDRAHLDDPTQDLIVVMPDGRSGQWYDYEDGAFLIETYVLDHLVPYVDQHFSTVPTREGRAVVGLSNGGYGALHLAAKRPDRFVAAGGMSSNVGARAMSGLGPAGGVHHQGSVPHQLAPNLDEVDVILDLGTSCTSDLTVDLCATLLVDLAFLPDHRAFQARMAEVGHRGTFDYRETEGAHAWRWWSRWLEERQLPFVLERLADPSPKPPHPDLPTEFRYRSIAPSFDIWDHHVEVEREVREFLDLRGVTAEGFELTGSGVATVTTAPRYRPGADYTVAGTGAGTRTVTADRTGRLRIRVDLGPSHAHDQFTAESAIAEQSGDHWVTRRVRIHPAAVGPSFPVPPAPPGADVRGTDHGRPPAGGAGPPESATAPRPTTSARRAPTTPDPRVSRAAPAEDGPMLAARATSGERAGAELVPTLAFLALLVTPPLWWYRRRLGDGTRGRGVGHAHPTTPTGENP